MSSCGRELGKITYRGIEVDELAQRVTDAALRRYLAQR